MCRGNRDGHKAGRRPALGALTQRIPFNTPSRGAQRGKETMQRKNIGRDGTWKRGAGQFDLLFRSTQHLLPRRHAGASVTALQAIGRQSCAQPIT